MQIWSFWRLGGLEFRGLLWAMAKPPESRPSDARSKISRNQSLHKYQERTNAGTPDQFMVTCPIYLWFTRTQMKYYSIVPNSKPPDSELPDQKVHPQTLQIQIRNPNPNTLETKARTPHRFTIIYPICPWGFFVCVTYRPLDSRPPRPQRSLKSVV